MRILILEDEPIIAIDLEEIVTDGLDATIVHACTVEQALAYLDRPDSGDIGFAILDLVLDSKDGECADVAARLIDTDIPFCFLSSAPNLLPRNYGHVPWIAKPFAPADVTTAIRSAFASRCSPSSKGSKGSTDPIAA